MSVNDKVAVEFLTWEKARKHLLPINPELAAIIDDWNPPSDFGFYKARYHYGDLLLDEGKLCLPLMNGETVLFTDGRVTKKIKEDLGYSSFPISIPMQKATEAFIELDQRVIPLAIFPTGVPLGLLETLDSIDSCCLRGIWNVSIGSRSGFLLPKISDGGTHHRVAKEFGLSVSKPTTSFEHFQVFKELSRSALFPDPDWHCDVLIMNKKWFEKDYKNYHWLRFNNYLHEFMVKYSTYTRNKATFDVMYQLFVKEITHHNKRIAVHFFDILKHIIATVIGASPAYRPFYDENHIGPFEAIQQIYVEKYGIGYTPTIMVPHHYDFRSDTRPVYCSMNSPSLFESHARGRKTESFIDDLFQLRPFIENFMLLARKGKLMLEGTILESALKNSVLDYFHTVPAGQFAGIHPTTVMPERDKKLNEIRLKGQIITDMKFSETSSFLRSCISIRSSRDAEK